MDTFAVEEVANSSPEALLVSNLCESRSRAWIPSRSDLSAFLRQVRELDRPELVFPSLLNYLNGSVRPRVVRHSFRKLFFLTAPACSRRS